MMGIMFKSESCIHPHNDHHFVVVKHERSSVGYANAFDPMVYTHQCVHCGVFFNEERGYFVPEPEPEPELVSLWETPSFWIFLITVIVFIAFITDANF